MYRTVPFLANGRKKPGSSNPGEKRQFKKAGETSHAGFDSAGAYFCLLLCIRAT